MLNTLKLLALSVSLFTAACVTDETTDDDLDYSDEATANDNDDVLDGVVVDDDMETANEADPTVPDCQPMPPISGQLANESGQLANERIRWCGVNETARIRQVR